MPSWRNLPGNHGLTGRTIGASSARSSASSKASRSPLDGRDHQPQLPRPASAASDVVVRLPGKDTELLGIDRGAERVASEAAARVGVGPAVVAMLDDPPCLVTAFVVGEPMSAERAARAGGAGRGRGGAAGAPRLRGATAGRASTRFRIVEDYAATDGRSAAPRSPPPTSGRTAAAHADRGGAGRTRARAGPLPQRPPRRQLHPRRRRDPDRRLGVRGDGRPLLRPRQLRRQQRARRGRGGGAARPPTSERRPTPAGWPRCG